VVPLGESSGADYRDAIGGLRQRRVLPGRSADDGRWSAKKQRFPDRRIRQEITIREELIEATVTPPASTLRPIRCTSRPACSAVLPLAIPAVPLRGVRTRSSPASIGGCCRRRYWQFSVSRCSSSQRSSCSAQKYRASTGFAVATAQSGAKVD